MNWLPKQLKFKLDARVALFKGYKVQAEQRLSRLQEIPHVLEDRRNRRS